MGITKTRAMLGFTALSSGNRAEFPLKKGGQGVVPLGITMPCMQYDLLVRFIQPPGPFELSQKGKCGLTTKMRIVVNWQYQRGCEHACECDNPKKWDVHNDYLYHVPSVSQSYKASVFLVDFPTLGF